MRPLIFILLLGLVLSAQAPSTVTIFEGARLITGDGSAPIENSAFIVEGTTFKQVGRQGQIAVPAGARRVNLAGKTVMPGKVDLHGHIGYQHDWDGTMAKEYFTRENLIDHLQRLATAGGQHEPGAALGGQQCGGQADAAGGAGDDHDLLIERFEIGCHRALREVGRRSRTPPRRMDGEIARVQFAVPASRFLPGIRR